MGYSQEEARRLNSNKLIGAARARCVVNIAKEVARGLMMHYIIIRKVFCLLLPPFSIQVLTHHLERPPARHFPNTTQPLIFHCQSPTFEYLLLSLSLY